MEVFMNTLSANDAKTNFGDALLRAQREPVHINKYGKPVAVLISAEDYESIESLKLQLLQLRVTQAKEQIKAGEFTDGESFFDSLSAGHFD